MSIIENYGYKNSIIEEVLKNMDERLTDSYVEGHRWKHNNKHRDLIDEIVNKLANGDYDLYQVCFILECVAEAIVFRKFTVKRRDGDDK